MFFRILQIAIPFIWFGAVGAISFMEAPLKFSAPNVTIPLGLGIGMIVFHALNKIEIVLCLLLALAFYRARPNGRFPLAAFGAVALILAMQTFVLFPLLDERSVQVINGTAQPGSVLHLIYIAAESVKVLVLLALGYAAARKSIKFE